jgi:hypothetical protein
MSSRRDLSKCRTIGAGGLYNYSGCPKPRPASRRRRSSRARPKYDAVINFDFNVPITTPSGETLIHSVRAGKKQGALQAQTQLQNFHNVLHKSPLSTSTKQTPVSISVARAVISPVQNTERVKSLLKNKTSTATPQEQIITLPQKKSKSKEITQVVREMDAMLNAIVDVFENNGFDSQMLRGKSAKEVLALVQQAQKFAFDNDEILQLQDPSLPSDIAATLVSWVQELFGLYLQLTEEDRAYLDTVATNYGIDLSVFKKPDENVAVKSKSKSVARSRLVEVEEVYVNPFADNNEVMTAITTETIRNNIEKIEKIEYLGGQPEEAQVFYVVPPPQEPKSLPAAFTEQDKQQMTDLVINEIASKYAVASRLVDELRISEAIEALQQAENELKMYMGQIYDVYPDYDFSQQTTDVIHKIFQSYPEQTNVDNKRLIIQLASDLGIDPKEYQVQSVRSLERSIERQNKVQQALEAYGKIEAMLIPLQSADFDNALELFQDNLAVFKQARVGLDKLQSLYLKLVNARLYTQVPDPLSFIKQALVLKELQKEIFPITQGKPAQEYLNAFDILNTGLNRELRQLVEGLGNLDKQQIKVVSHFIVDHNLEKQMKQILASSDRERSVGGVARMFEEEDKAASEREREQEEIRKQTMTDIYQRIDELKKQQMTPQVFVSWYAVVQDIQSIIRTAYANGLIKNEDARKLRDNLELVEDDLRTKSGKLLNDSLAKIAATVQQIKSSEDFEIVVEKLLRLKDMSETATPQTLTVDQTNFLNTGINNVQNAAQKKLVEIENKAVAKQIVDYLQQINKQIEDITVNTSGWPEKLSTISTNAQQQTFLTAIDVNNIATKAEQKRNVLQGLVYLTGEDEIDTVLGKLKDLTQFNKEAQIIKAKLNALQDIGKINTPQLSGLMKKINYLRQNLKDTALAAEQKQAMEDVQQQIGQLKTIEDCNELNSTIRKYNSETKLTPEDTLSLLGKVDQKKANIQAKEARKIEDDIDKFVGASSAAEIDVALEKLPVILELITNSAGSEQIDANQAIELTDKANKLLQRLQQAAESKQAEIEVQRVKQEAEQVKQEIIKVDPEVVYNQIQMNIAKMDNLKYEEQYNILIQAIKAAPLPQDDKDGLYKELDHRFEFFKWDAYQQGKYQLLAEAINEGEAKLSLEIIGSLMQSLDQALSQQLHYQLNIKGEMQDLRDELAAPLNQLIDLYIDTLWSKMTGKKATQAKNKLVALGVDERRFELPDADADEFVSADEFEEAQEMIKRQPGKKLNNIRKPDCTGDDRTWIVGKGCFEYLPVLEPELSSSIVTGRAKRGAQPARAARPVNLNEQQLEQEQWGNRRVTRARARK